MARLPHKLKPHSSRRLSHSSNISSSSRKLSCLRFNFLFRGAASSKAISIPRFLVELRVFIKGEEATAAAAGALRDVDSDDELYVWCTAFGFVGVRNWSGTYVLMLLVQLSSAQLRLVQALPAPELLPFARE